MSDPQTILYGSNAPFVEALYEDWLADPASVSDAWRKFFEGMANGQKDVPHSGVQAAFAELARVGAHRLVAPAAPSAAAGPATAASGGNMGVAALLEAVRSHGHVAARFNPLVPGEDALQELTPAFHGVTAADMDQPIQSGPFRGPLRQVLAQLMQTYCGPIGFETVHLPREEREWL